MAKVDVRLQTTGTFKTIKVDILFVCGKQLDIKFVGKLRKVLDYLYPPVSSKIVKISDVEEQNIVAEKTVSMFNSSLDVARLFVELGVSSEKHNCCIVQMEGEIGFAENADILNVYVHNKQNYLQWWPQVFVFLCGRSKHSVSGPCFFMYDYTREPHIQYVHDFINACERAGIHFATLQHASIVQAARALIIKHSGWGCQVYENNKKILDNLNPNKMPIIVIARSRLALDEELEQIADTIEPDLNNPLVLAWVLCKTKQVDHEMKPIHRGYPVPLVAVDKLIDLCFIVYGLVAGLVALFGFGIFFSIAVGILAMCGRWDDFVEGFNRHIIFRIIFATHVLLYLGTIGLLVVNFLIWDFKQIYSVPFYTYSLSFVVLFLRFVLAVFFPWYAKWPLRGITGTGDLFL